MFFFSLFHMTWIRFKLYSFLTSYGVQFFFWFSERYSFSFSFLMMLYFFFLQSVYCHQTQIIYFRLNWDIFHWKQTIFGFLFISIVIDDMNIFYASCILCIRWRCETMLSKKHKSITFLRLQRFKRGKMIILLLKLIWTRKISL